MNTRVVLVVSGFPANTRQTPTVQTSAYSGMTYIQRGTRNLPPRYSLCPRTDRDAHIRAKRVLRVVNDHTPLVLQAAVYFHYFFVCASGRIVPIQSERRPCSGVRRGWSCRRKTPWQIGTPAPAPYYRQCVSLQKTYLNSLKDFVCVMITERTAFR